LGLVLLSCSVAPALAAPAQKGLTFRPRPRPEARAFLITEFLYGNELDGSFSNGHLFSWQLGFMINADERNSFGCAAALDLLRRSESGVGRIGPYLRYRRWLSTRKSIDGALGVVWSDRGTTCYAADTSFNPTTWLGLGFRTEWWNDNNRGEDKTVFYPTARLAGAPGASMTGGLVLLAATVTVLLLTVSD